MAHKITKQEEQLRQRMLSGEPFTYGDLCDEFVEKARGDQDPDRLVDGLIQKLRRAGFISFKRAGKKTLWTATPAGIASVRQFA